MTYTCINCYATFDKSHNLEAHKQTCRSHKNKSGKLKSLIQTLSLSAHRNHKTTSGPGPAIASIHHEILGLGQPEVPVNPERNNDSEGDLNLDIQCLHQIFFMKLN